ncbi:hypothetical protein BDQ17DRAFT_721747 [Cyathus striatus]|nr:hypothetical protein BDQ17DRAFT_721747 [Cyathus striatus]
MTPNKRKRTTAKNSARRIHVGGIAKEGESGPEGESAATKKSLSKRGPGETGWSQLILEWLESGFGLRVPGLSLFPLPSLRSHPHLTINCNYYLSPRLNPSSLHLAPLTFEPESSGRWSVLCGTHCGTTTKLNSFFETSTPETLHHCFDFCQGHNHNSIISTLPAMPCTIMMRFHIEISRKIEKEAQQRNGMKESRRI